jgi:aminocarboxymuconate-semialdehyde decarboxylase
MGELGLHGVEIGTHVDANEYCHGSDCRNLDHPSLEMVWSAAEQTDAAIFVHPWDMLGKQRMRKYWLPWLVGMPAETSLAICSMIFGGVFERFPQLRVAFAHGGGAFPFTIGRIEHAFHVRPDLVAVDNGINPRNYLARLNSDGQPVPGRFYVDSLVHDVNALEMLLKMFGANRIALGSDYPFPLGEAKPGELVESMAQLSESARKHLLSETAREFLRIKP